ncbi:MAG: hypothetical protein H7067_09020, partial [Burkholderiales bacterium]|nr:hypothetical protein [Opitutaceae bacterium]
SVTATLSCELALAHRRDGAILLRPLGLGYSAHSAATVSTACRLRVEIVQEPALPPFPPPAAAGASV